MGVDGHDGDVGGGVDGDEENVDKSVAAVGIYPDVVDKFGVVVDHDDGANAP